MAEESNTLIWPQNAVFFFVHHHCSTVPWLDFGLNKISHPSLPKLGTPIQEYGVTLRFDLQLYLSLFCSTTLLALSLVINVGHKVLSFPHEKNPKVLVYYHIFPFCNFNTESFPISMLNISQGNGGQFVHHNQF